MGTHSTVQQAWHDVNLNERLLIKISYIKKQTKRMSHESHAELLWKWLSYQAFVYERLHWIITHHPCKHILLEFYLKYYTLKKYSLLKIENNSSWVNFTHFRENVPSRTWVDFRQVKLASLHVYKIWFLKWKARML